MPAGRPTVMTEEALYVLEGAFADGASDGMACFLAKISPATLYNYQKEHPEFLERKDWLKDQVRFQARKNVREAVKKGDTDMTKWFLDRRDKDFKPKSDLTSDNKPIPIYGGLSTQVPGHGSDQEDIQSDETD